MAGRLTTPIQPYRAAPLPIDRSVQYVQGLPGVLGSDDYYDRGPARIRGVVDVNNVLAARFMYLLEIRTFRIIRFTVSDPVTGAFGFYNLPSNKDYFVVGYDNARTENMVSWDRVTTYTPP